MSDVFCTTCMLMYGEWLLLFFVKSAAAIPYLLSQLLTQYHVYIFVNTPSVLMLKISIALQAYGVEFDESKVSAYVPVFCALAIFAI